MSYFNLIQKDIQNQGLAVVLASNPRNPTGQVNIVVSFGNVIELVLTDNYLYLPGHQVSLLILYIPPLDEYQQIISRGDDLRNLVSLSREGTTVVLDEVIIAPHKFRGVLTIIFTAHSSIPGTYTPKAAATWASPVSSAQYIEDVNEVCHDLTERILRLTDFSTRMPPSSSTVLTKVSTPRATAAAPKRANLKYIIELASSGLACLLGHWPQEPHYRPFQSGSFLDGGANHP